MTPDESPRVGIVGGGVAGLAAAYELERAAEGRVSIDLYEAAPRLGGVVRTEHEDGFLLDAGPDSMVTFKPAALELCREVGLEDAVISTIEERSGVAVYSRGALRPLPLGNEVSTTRKIATLLGSGLISWPGKLRFAADLVLPRGRMADDESMADFFGRRVGSEIVERLVDPVLAGIYNGDPARLSIESTFPRLRDTVRRNRSLVIGMLKGRRGRRRSGSGSAFRSLRGGLGDLVAAVAERLSATRAMTNTPVAGVDRSDASFAVRTHAGERQSYSAAVLAVPTHVAARLIFGLAPEIAGRLGAIRYVSSATVFFGYRLDELGARPAGHGFLVPAVEGRRINGATWASNKYPGRAPDGGFLARCYVGGDRTPETLELDDSALVRVCREELREMAGIEADPLFARVFRFERSNPQYEVGHADRIAWVEDRLATYPGLFLTGAGYRGVGLADAIGDGRATARAVAAHLFERTAARSG